MGTPNTEDFKQAIFNIFENAEERGKDHVDINAGNLHRSLGYYPNKGNHRMFTCCRVMRKMMKINDEILYEPPSGYGPSLTIRYRLPR